MAIMSVSLGMPSAPAPVLAPRRKTRQIRVGKVGVGSDFPISVQSMTTTPTTDVNATLQQIAELTAPAATSSASPAPARTTPRPCRPSPGSHRSRSSPTSTSSRSTSTRPSTPGAPPSASTRATSASSTTRSARSPAAPRRRGVSIRIGVNAGSLDKRLLEKYGKATPRPSSSRPCGRRASSRSTTSTTSRSRSSTTTPSRWSARTSCSPSAATGRCTSASPRPAPPSRAPSSRPRPSARCSPRASATRSGSPLRAAGRGGQGRQPDPQVARPQAAQARDRLVPVVRPCPGRRLHARRPGDRRTRGPHRPAARRRHGLRRQRPRRGPRGRPRRRVRQRQGPDLRQGRGHQDRPREPDRRDAHRGGHAHRRGDGGAGRRESAGAPTITAESWDGFLSTERYAAVLALLRRIVAPPPQERIAVAGRGRRCRQDHAGRRDRRAEGHRRHVVRVSIDGFHHPSALRTATVAGRSSSIATRTLRGAAAPHVPAQLPRSTMSSRTAASACRRVLRTWLVDGISSSAGSPSVAWAPAPSRTWRAIPRGSKRRRWPGPQRYAAGRDLDNTDLGVPTRFPIDLTGCQTT